MNLYPKMLYFPYMKKIALYTPFFEISGVYGANFFVYGNSCRIFLSFHSNSSGLGVKIVLFSAYTLALVRCAVGNIQISSERG